MYFFSYIHGEIKLTRVEKNSDSENRCFHNIFIFLVFKILDTGRQTYTQNEEKSSTTLMIYKGNQIIYDLK